MNKKGVIMYAEEVITECGGEAIEVTALYNNTDNDEPEMKCKEYVIKPSTAYSTTYGKAAGVPADTLANGLLEVSKVMASNALDYDKLIADINKVKNDE